MYLSEKCIFMWRYNVIEIAKKVIHITVHLSKLTDSICHFICIYIYIYIIQYYEYLLYTVYDYLK